MANISVTVQDGNNITLVSTPTATQVITIDRGIAGPAGPAGVPGGSTTQVQYNLNSAFAGSPNFTFNGSNLVLQSASASDAFRITQTGAGNALVVEDSANPDTTPFVIDNTGRVIVGYTTRFAPDVNAPTIFPQVSVFGVSATAQYSAFSYINAAANAPVVSLSKSRGATIGTNTIVAINDTIGIVKFTAADGTAFVPAASISAQVDGTPGLNDMPGRLVFSTTADGAATSTERMRIDSIGNVGIGTITPLTALNVNGTGGELIRISVTSNSGVQQEPALGFATGVTNVYPATMISALEFDASDSRASMLFYTRGTNSDVAPTEAMRIDSAGNVGIGTSAPTARLELTTDSLNQGIRIYRPLATSGGGYEGILFALNNTSGTKTDYASISANSTIATTGSEAGSISFKTFGLGALTEKMRLDSSGNLGVGTTSPTQKLEVNGAALVNGTSGFARVAITGTPASGAAALQISINSVNARTLRMENTISGGHTYDIINGGVSAGNLAIYDDTVGAYRLIIDSSGNLGLGVTPSAWYVANSNRAIQIGSYLSLLADNQNGYASLANNAYQSTINQASGWNYVTTNAAAKYTQTLGSHAWYNAPSGTAGAAITFTQAMTLDASGNLGVGTTSPASRVDIVQATNDTTNGLTLRGYTTGTDGGRTFNINTVSSDLNNWANLNFKAQQFTFSIQGTEKMRLDSAGNLGIGTTSPGYKLDVRSGSTGTTAYFNSLATTAYNPTAYNGGSARVILYGGGATSAFTGIQFSQGGSFETFFGAVQNASGYGDFVWQGYGGTYAERMRLDSAGNLGLGVTPSAWSTSAKAIQLGAYSMLYQNASGYPELAFNTYINTSNIFTYQVSGNVATRYSQTNGVHSWYNAPSGTAGAAITFTQAMTLDANGNLGIGTTSPSTKLDIAGTLRIDATSNIYGKADNTSFVSLYGGGAYNAGAGIGLGGTSQAVNPNIIVFTRGSYVETARFDAAGNLGLGTIPSAWGSSYKAMQLGTLGTSGITIAGNDASLGTNYYLNSSGNITYTTTGAVTYLSMYNGQFRFYIAPSGTAGTTASITHAMTLDASGNLVVGSTIANRAGAAHGLSVEGTTTSVLEANVGGSRAGYMYSFNTGTYIGEFRNGPLSFTTNDTVKMTLDASGNLLVGTTSPAGSERFNVTGSVANNIARFINNNAASYGTLIQYGSGIDPNGAGNEFIDCRANVSTLRFNVRSNGGITNYQANNVNLSDRREKINFAPAGEYLSKICAIPVQTFNYIDQNMEEDSGLTLGVIAQDVQAVAPELVAESNWGTRDEQKLRLSIYQTDLQYALMKCIQEQQALITTLTDRITALEAK